MKLIYLGGAREVGASSILLEIDNYKILLDSGIRQKSNKDKLPDFNSIQEIGGIDAILISHAHMDHIGSLPIISSEYPSAKIYMNKMTMELAHVLLSDSLKIMNYQEGEIPLYDENKVELMFNRIELVPYQKEISLTNTIKVTFYMAGHIAGASAIYIKGKEGSIFYTGDFSITKALTVSGMSIPKLRPDVIISEATYGDRLHANREAEEERLIRTISETITKGGKVLIPVFALGRSQEVLLILKRAFNKKQLPKVKVYVDGMVRNINTVFLKNPLYLKESLGKRILKGQEAFYNDEIIRVDTKEEREKISMKEGPFIIVASSGMLTGGMSEYYAQSIVGDAKNAIILTGYQDEESNGSKLLNLLDKEDKKIELNQKTYNVLCNIEKVGLSAHADKQEIMGLFTSLKPKSIILGHGDTDVITKFAKEITKENNFNLYAPSVGELLNLEIKNPRKQIDYKLEYLYYGDKNLKDFYEFIKDKYQERLFTKEDLTYIYYAKPPINDEIENFTKELIDSPYFTQDNKRFFLFKIQNELDIKETKEINSQDLETIIKLKFKDYPYKKISYYLDDKKIVLTFDFPRVIDDNFNLIAEEFERDTNFKVIKNDNINNLACEAVIKEILGYDNIDKISYLPIDDKFKVKVYELKDTKEITKRIGYDIELVLTERKENSNNINLKNIEKGEKLEQNMALAYIDDFFSKKDDKPYKKSLKNGNIVLSFITYEIGLKYEDDIKNLETDIGYKIELNTSPNINMIFNLLDNLLLKYNLVKVKNPSYISKDNKVEVKVQELHDVNQIVQEFKDKTKLELNIVE